MNCANLPVDYKLLKDNTNMPQLRLIDSHPSGMVVVLTMNSLKIENYAVLNTKKK